VLDTWRKVHDEVWKSGKYGLPAKWTSFRHLFRSCAALVILSMLFAFVNFGITVMHMHPRFGNYQPFPVISLTIAIIDTVLVVGSFVCACFALYNSEYYPESTNLIGTIGLATFLGGGIMKFTSIPKIAFIILLLLCFFILLLFELVGCALDMIKFHGDDAAIEAMIGDRAGRFINKLIKAIWEELTTSWC
jgi:hypothetical protein